MRWSCARCVDWSRSASCSGRRLTPSARCTASAFLVLFGCSCLRRCPMTDVDWSEYAHELRRIESFSAFGSYSSAALKAAASLCELRSTQTRGILADDLPTPVVGTPRVCVESPLSGDVTTHVLYADACQFDCLLRDEAPFLGHLLYPRVLDDANEYDRERGINAHMAWLRRADLVAFYVDFGVTRGMK